MKYDPDCYKCDTDDHVCPGCGEPLNHDGTQINGEAHGTRCVD